MEKYYIKNDNNRMENPFLTQGEGKKRLRRGEEEGKKRLRRGREVAGRDESKGEAGFKQGLWLMVLRVAAVMAVMVILGEMAWGQSTIPNGDGYYYIINNSTWYLKPATIYYQGETEMPFLTTNTTGQVSGSLWIIKSNGNYHQVIHAEDGKYVTANENVMGNSNQHRKRIHLESMDTPGDNNDFVFVINGTKYNIRHKTMVEGSHKWWNPSGGNQTYDNGGSNGYSGIIGLYSNANDNGSLWQLVFVSKCVTPEISYTADGTVTITSVTPSTTIYYTTNGSDPTTSSTEYTGSFPLTGTTTVKAIAVKTGFTNSEIAERTITQTSQPGYTYNCDNTISITCADLGAIIVYTTDGSIPNASSPQYTAPFTPASGTTITAKAYVENVSFLSTAATTTYTTSYTDAPTITVNGDLLTITGQGNIYYTTDGSDPDPDDPSQQYNNPVILPSSGGETIIKAIAKDGALEPSCVAQLSVLVAVRITTLAGLSGIADHPSWNYRLDADIDVSAFATSIDFTGVLDGNHHTLTGLTRPLFNTVSGGTVRNVMLKKVAISQSGNVGAICGTADGDSRIYNCGILPTNPNFNETSTVASTNAYCGGLVGLLDGTSRVINCFSFANITGGTTVAGIVGYNNTSGATQDNYTEKTIVMNCMFYGEITDGTTKYPVYGGNVIANDGTTAINNYNYYRGDATFDDGYTAIANYNRSWPAEERNLRRFEYYRSILNSNRRLCTWWVGGTANTVPTDNDVATIGIAKWVLDPSIAPYPVLKPWGKYPSIINPDPEKVWDTVNNAWVQRSSALPYQGKSLGTLSVTVNTGSHPGTLSGLTTRSKIRTLVITDMDTLHYDYCYGKVQLPYYNEIFGDASSSDHLTRYYGNYTDKVVTAWKITAVATDGTVTDYHSFVADWQEGYNYADRHCTEKDIYDSNGNRAFAQGGYYYVPDGVTGITIEAIWGTAFYMHGKGHSLDRVSVCSYEGETKNYGYAFTPAGTLPSTWVYNNMTIYDDLSSAVSALATTSATVYDQAIVLVGNFQVQARNDISLGNTDGKKVTFMSADLDMDNEPDFCWQFQWRSNTNRLPILPVRFDFLPIPELGLAIRHNKYAYAIGIFVPQGHFEITETAFMHTTQFEYMSANVNVNHQQPLILNGGEFEQIVVHGGGSSSMANTRNIIMGGHIWMKRFTPGSHSGQHAYTRHCAVSVMGGEFPEFYLTGLYWTDVTTSTAYDDSPHCYTNGSRFGLMAGAGMEAVKNNVVFEIDHSVIDEFYGGGINANNPVAGNVSVTINNSLVLDKYCGGPQIGSCQTVTTNATGTTFNQYFGGGNGGTNLYRENKVDGNQSDMPSAVPGSWNGWNNFKPISTQGVEATYDAAKGYHAEYEFEVFNQSNGINTEAVVRTYYHWAQFGTTETDDVTNELNNCTVKHNYYSAGNLGNVSGDVTSTLTDCTILGSAFGAGFSATIPSFPVHDKSKVQFPYRDAAGVCHNGSVGYRTDDDDNIIYYTWCYKNSETNVVLPAGVEIPAGVTTSKPAFQYDGKWYCYTTVSLEGLGAVSGNATLTIKGSTTIGTLESGSLVEGTGNVFGGGDESAVTGSTTVHLQGNAHVLGNVYGGGNNGPVGGDSKVEIQNE